MSKIVSFGVIAMILLLQVQAADLCPTFISSAQCQQNNSCEWVQTTEQSCQQALDCSAITVAANCYQNKSNCNWNQLKAPSCSVKADYCKLNDQNTCTDPDNCTLVQPAAQTCQPKGSGFGCSSFSQQDCTNQAECQYVASQCKVNESVCATYGSKQCTDANNCVQNVQSCKLKANAKATCLQLADQKSCVAQGCVYANNACSAPTQCTVSNNQCSAICDVNNITCTTKQGVCNQTTDVTCKAVNNCQWDTTAQCQDKSNYCTADKCDVDFCINIPATKLACVANTQTNGCNGQTTQQGCTDLAQCNYNQQVNANCSNVQQLCLAFTYQNYCKAQNGCNWSPISKCQSATSPSTNATRIAFNVAAVIISSLALLF